MLVEVGMRVMIKKELREIIDGSLIPFGLNNDMYRLQGKIVTVTRVVSNYAYDRVLGQYERVTILEDEGMYAWNRFMLEGIVLEDNKIVPIGQEVNYEFN